MDFSSSSFDSFPDELKEKLSMVDPFLVEALQNPRHRLTILRMELDIQKFLQNQEQQLFHFQHFPTSYLRLAAHRVAQHYCLQTMVHDNCIDGQGRILVRKTVEAKFPPIYLSQIPVQQSVEDRHEHVKIVTRPRANRSSEGTTCDCMVKQSLSRTVEQRKEEYNRARARIFNVSDSSGSADVMPNAPREKQFTSINRDETKECRVNDVEKNTSIVDVVGTTPRIAILRDREKDLSDPDYNRNYERYVKIVPIDPSLNFTPLCTMQKIQPPFLHYDPSYFVTRNEVSLGYVSPPIPINGPIVGLNPASPTTIDARWLGEVSPYAHIVFQGPYWQQPFGF